MDIVIRSKTLMLGMGAAPILYLMIALSVISIAVIAERAWYFFRASGDVRKLAIDLDELLHKAVRKPRASASRRSAPSSCRRDGGPRQGGEGRRRRYRGDDRRRRDAAHATRARTRVSGHAGQQRAIHRPARHRRGYHHGVPEARRGRSERCRVRRVR